jgi:ABC-type sugar transport system substrate-binding protein
MRNTFTFAAVIAAAALVLTGCSTSAASTTAGTASTTAKGSYVFLPKSLDNPYWVDAKAGMDSGAKQLKVSAQFLGPASDDAAKQVAIFESILATKPLGIAVSPNDPASVKDVIKRARAAGIPVIAWDGPVPDSQVQGYVGTDNVAAGVAAGKALATAMGGKGTVGVIIGSLSAPNLKQRLDGVKEELKKFPGISIATIEESGESIANAQTRAETVLQANPKLSAFIGIGGSDLPGIAGALKSAGRCGVTKAVGFDVVPQGIDAMKSKCVDALISQKPFGMTAKALEILVKMHNKTWDQKDGFVIDTGVDTVLPADLDAFLASAPH